MLARRWRSWLQKKILDPSASHFSFAFILVYLYKTQGGRPAFSQFRWPFCGTRVLVANAATNSTSLHFTTICLVRKMASFARVHRKPDAQQFGVTSTTPRFTLFWWMEHLFPNNLQCPAQRIPLPFAFLNHALFLVLSHTEFASPTPLHKISLCLAHWKKWLYCIHATHWIGEPEPERVSSRIYGINADWQPFFFRTGSYHCVKESVLFVKTMFPRLKYILTWT